MTPFIQKTIRTLLVIMMILSLLCVTACDNGKDPSSSEPTSSAVDTDDGNEDESSEDDEYDGEDDEDSDDEDYDEDSDEDYDEDYDEDSDEDSDEDYDEDYDEDSDEDYDEDYDEDSDDEEEPESSKPSDTSSNNSTNKPSSNASSNVSSNTSSGPKVNVVGGELTADILTEIPEGEVEEEVPFPRDKDIINTKTGTPKTGDSDVLAAKRRQEILNTPNTDFKPTGNGRYYYVSSHKGSNKNDGLTPETPLRNITTLVPEPGSVILFERGSVFRLNAALQLKSNITYASYGEGEKPAFYACPYNYAKKELWQPSRMKNVWYATFGDTDCSAVVFNHGEDIGVKKQGGINQLTSNGDFFHNATLTTIYLYCDKGNPGEVYEDIEVVLRSAVFKVSGCDNVTVDNIALKYGNFGISLNGNSGNCTFTNLEIGYIGGANIGVGGNRYGNGIEWWDGASGKNIVDNCWVYQCFDTGLTWQGSNGYDYDCTFTNNLIEYCCLSIEFWDRGEVKNEDEESVINFICNDNISRFSGFGWGNRSWDNGIRGIEGHLGGGFNRMKTVYAEFKNNIFDQAWNQAIRIPDVYDESDPDPLATRKIIFEGNSYYEGSNHVSTERHSSFESFEKDAAGEYIAKIFTFDSQKSLEEMVAFIGEKNPKIVKFLG